MRHLAPAREMSDYDYMDERLTTPGPVVANQNESLTLSSGTRFGRYEILSPLGAGGMGEVYRARDTRLGRDLAIKILSSKLSPGKQDFERFEREACSASALNHPNIVTIFELGQVDTTYYIAMELVEGELLRDMLTGGPIPLQKAIPIATQTADGLAKAHEAGVLHRDLKPENLMVSRDGFVKILDFGLAKLVNRDSDQLPGAAALATSQTLPGAVLGTIETFPASVEQSSRPTNSTHRSRSGSRGREGVAAARRRARGNAYWPRRHRENPPRAAGRGGSRSELSQRRVLCSACRGE